MAVTLVTRTLIDLEPALFPNGVEPGSLIQLHGASGSGQTYLIMHLLARFVKNFTQKRVIYIDTRNMFNSTTFCKILIRMGLEGNIDPALSHNHPDVLKRLVPYLDRVTVIKCFTPEDLLFCFGPKNAGMLEKMLLTCSDFSLVIVDSLNNFSYCASLPNINRRNHPDFFMLLKRSVEPTKTPVICVMDDVKKGRTETEQENLQFLKTENLVEANIFVDRSRFTHSIFLQRLEPPPRKQAGGTNSEEDSEYCELVYRAHLRSKNNPSMALSGASHRVKFSILSGILEWRPEDES